MRRDDDGQERPDRLSMPIYSSFYSSVQYTSFSNDMCTQNMNSGLPLTPAASLQHNEWNTHHFDNAVLYGNQVRLSAVPYTPVPMNLVDPNQGIFRLLQSYFPFYVHNNNATPRILLQPYSYYSSQSANYLPIQPSIPVFASSESSIRNVHIPDKHTETTTAKPESGNSVHNHFTAGYSSASARSDPHSSRVADTRKVVVSSTKTTAVAVNSFDKRNVVASMKPRVSNIQPSRRFTSATSFASSANSSSLQERGTNDVGLTFISSHTSSAFTRKGSAADQKLNVSTTEVAPYTLAAVPAYSSRRATRYKTGSHSKVPLLATPFACSGRVDTPTEATATGTKKSGDKVLGSESASNCDRICLLLSDTVMISDSDFDNETRSGNKNVTVNGVNLSSHYATSSSSYLNKKARSIKVYENKEDRQPNSDSRVISNSKLVDMPSKPSCINRLNRIVNRHSSLPSNADKDMSSLYEDIDFEVCRATSKENCDRICLLLSDTAVVSDSELEDVHFKNCVANDLGSRQNSARLSLPVDINQNILTMANDYNLCRDKSKGNGPNGSQTASLMSDTNLIVDAESSTCSKGNIASDVGLSSCSTESSLPTVTRRNCEAQPAAINNDTEVDASENVTDRVIPFGEQDNDELVDNMSNEKTVISDICSNSQSEKPVHTSHEAEPEPDNNTVELCAHHVVISDYELEDGELEATPNHKKVATNAVSNAQDSERQSLPISINHEARSVPKECGVEMSSSGSYIVISDCEIEDSEVSDTPSDKKVVTEACLNPLSTSQSLPVYTHHKTKPATGNCGVEVCADDAYIVISDHELEDGEIEDMPSDEEHVSSTGLNLQSAVPSSLTSVDCKTKPVPTDYGVKVCPNERKVSSSKTAGLMESDVVVISDSELEDGELADVTSNKNVDTMKKGPQKLSPHDRVDKSKYVTLCTKSSPRALLFECLSLCNDTRSRRNPVCSSSSSTDVSSCKSGTRKHNASTSAPVTSGDRNLVLRTQELTPSTVDPSEAKESGNRPMSTCQGGLTTVVHSSGNKVVDKAAFCETAAATSTPIMRPSIGVHTINPRFLAPRMAVPRDAIVTQQLLLASRSSTTITPVVRPDIGVVIVKPRFPATQMSNIARPPAVKQIDLRMMRPSSRQPVTEVPVNVCRGVTVGQTVSLGSCVTAATSSVPLFTTELTRAELKRTTATVISQARRALQISSVAVRQVRQILQLANTRVIRTSSCVHTANPRFRTSDLARPPATKQVGLRISPPSVTEVPVNVSRGVTVKQTVSLASCVTTTASSFPPVTTQLATRTTTLTSQAKPAVQIGSASVRNKRRKRKSAPSNAGNEENKDSNCSSKVPRLIDAVVDAEKQQPSSQALPSRWSRRRRRLARKSNDTQAAVTSTSTANPQPRSVPPTCRTRTPALSQSRSIVEHIRSRGTARRRNVNSPAVMTDNQKSKHLEEMLDCHTWTLYAEPRAEPDILLENFDPGKPAFTALTNIKRSTRADVLRIFGDRACSVAEDDTVDVPFSKDDLEKFEERKELAAELDRMTEDMI